MRSVAVLTVGKNPADASARRQRKQAELNAVNNGVSVVPDGRNGHRSAATAIAEFLDETKLTVKTTEQISIELEHIHGE